MLSLTPYEIFALTCTVVVGSYVCSSLYTGTRDGLRLLRAAKRARAERAQLLRCAHAARQAGVAPIAVEPERACRTALLCGPLVRPSASQELGS